MCGLKKALFALSILFLTISIAFGGFDTEKLYIETDNAVVSDVGIVITLVSGQSGLPIEILDSLDDYLVQFYPNGHIQNLDGFNTECTQYGSGLLVHNYGEQEPEHTNGIGSYDHTGGTEEMIFTKTSGDDFTVADANNGTWIILQGANTGATAEIKTYISATQVTVDGMNWTDDLASQSFWIVKHPSLVVGDGNEIEFSAGATGKVEVHSYDFTGGSLFEVELDAMSDSQTAFELDFNGNGYNTIAGMLVNHNPGDIQPGDAVASYVVQVDETESVNADDTSIIAGIGLITTDTSDATKKGIVMLPGWSIAMEVQGAEPVDPDYGYEVTSGTVVDRVNSGGGGNDAFINPAVDIELYDSNADYILIGDDNTFEIIEIILDISSSKDILETVQYSTGAGTWGTLTLKGDGLGGWTKSGLYTFDAPAGWVKVSEAEAAADITDAYYIKIQRTKGGAIPTLPTENYFKIYDDTSTSFRIWADGSIELGAIADADASNNRMYYSTTQSKLVYKDLSGTVNDLY